MTTTVDNIMQYTDEVLKIDPKKAAMFLRFDYTYPQYFLEDLLWKTDFSQLPKTEFVDYSWFLNYHESERYRLHVRLGAKERVLELPYKEIINFAMFPGATILVEGAVRPYTMSDRLMLLTQANFDAFYKVKRPFDAPKLRLAYLGSREGSVSCTLESTSYFCQVRTNLTVDYPIPMAKAVEYGFAQEEPDLPTVVNLRHLDTPPDRRLRPPHMSLLANTIGVAGLVYFRRGDENYFVMSLRQNEVGVFENMFGSVSGTGMYERGLVGSDLVSYARDEVSREFEEETGLKRNVIKRIVPLGFARELIRGGKPQFFFLVEIPPIEVKLLKTRFRESLTGTREFRKSLIMKGINSHRPLSPEFTMNLVYALQFLQSEYGTPLKQLVLSKGQTKR